MKTITWVTPDYFLETDIYVVPELANYFKIQWIIEYGCNKEDIPFYSELQLIKEGNLVISFIQRPNAHPLSPQFWSFYWNFISIIKSKKPAAIYSAILGIPYIPFCILRIPRKKIIFAAHNVTTPKGIKHYRLTKFYMGLVWNWFKNFQNFSMSQYNLLKTKYHGKNNFYAPFVLKNYGVPTNKPNDIITFLSFGRIRGYKCVDVLINAAQKVKERCNIPFKVLIAGECSQWEKYQSMIKYPEIFDLRIHNVDNKDIPNLFGECHYTVLPYQDIAQSGAMFVCINYSKPSILSFLPAFSEYLTDGVDGLFIRPANVDDLTDKMLYVIKNHDEVYPSLVKNLNDNKAKNFEKTVIIGKYKHYLETVICPN